MSEGYKPMSPDDARGAMAKTNELMRHGAKIGEEGSLEVTDAQIETARAEMVAAQVNAKIDEALALITGVSEKDVISALNTEGSARSRAVAELLHKMLVGG